MTPTTLLWLVTGCLMLQPLSTDLYLASLPGMASDFGVSPAAVQQTLSLFVFGFCTAQLVSGPLSDRYGRNPVMIAGPAVYLVSGLACALAPSLDWLVAARFVQAIGCCTAVVVARAVIRDAYSPAEGARVLAKALSLLSLAPIFGPILGGYLQVNFGWRAAFVALALAGLAVWFSALRHMKESNSQPNPDGMRIARPCRTTRFCLCLCCMNRNVAERFQSFTLAPVAADHTNHEEYKQTNRDYSENPHGCINQSAYIRRGIRQNLT